MEAGGAFNIRFQLVTTLRVQVTNAEAMIQGGCSPARAHLGHPCPLSWHRGIPESSKPDGHNRPTLLRVDIADDPTKLPIYGASDRSGWRRPAAAPRPRASAVKEQKRVALKWEISYGSETRCLILGYPI